MFAGFLNTLKLRWKLLFLVLPLVIAPIVIVAGIVGYISNRQAYLGISQTSRDDLQHMASFTTDLLNSHYQQFQVYRQDRIRILNADLASLVDLSYNLVQAEYKLAEFGTIDPALAMNEVGNLLRKINAGGSGYIYVMTSRGELRVHVAREGDNVINEHDGTGRYFIREMRDSALREKPGALLYTTYPWRNEVLGDIYPREKTVAYRYFKKWDWIIAAGGYLEENSDAVNFERRSFAELKERIKSKRVGATGYIFCMDRKGNFTIHPESEGKNFYDSRDSNGNAFIREMCEKKSGWIRYPWKNPGDSTPRMKIVRYEYFEPWDWIVAAGSYEDEFYREANSIKESILFSTALLILLAGAFSVSMVYRASDIITEPVTHMIEVIRKIRKGNLDVRVDVSGQDEIAEMGTAFNRMADIIQRNREMEATLAQQGKMASLGVLSSGVAHEINNPLGVILGYAAYLEAKLAEDDQNYRYVHEIKRESKRCKKIVQDLLSYARTPRPLPELVNINELLSQIVDFSANHTDMRNVKIMTDFSPDVGIAYLDGDQMRQVAINIILNSGGAMPDGGELRVETGMPDERHVRIVFSDTGCGIPDESIERIFEPFYTTKSRGTGLGLAITRQIVEQHHGEIRVESKPGRGTMVTLILPVEPEEFFQI